MTEKLWQGWKYWKNKTQIEKDAIDSMLKAKNYILKNIPKKEIVSIYVYGSFVRREMTKDSDVDMFVILKSNKYLGFSEKITMEAISSWKVRTDIFFLSLEELKTGKRANKQKGKLPLPRSFISSGFKKTRAPIYGKKVPFDKFPYDSNEKILENGFFLVRRVSFKIEQDMFWRKFIKRFFQIEEIKQWVKGKETPIKYREMASLLENKKPIIKEIVYYLLDTTPEEVGIKERKRFAKKARRYIKSSHYWYYKKIKNKSTFYAWKKLQIEKIDPWIGHIGERINKNSPKTYKFLKKIKIGKRKNKENE